jgi:integrase
MRLKVVDLLAEDGPPRPLRPTSLNNVRVNIRQFASALVERGHPIEEITRLSYLVEVDHFRDGLRYFISRNGGEAPSWLKVTAASIMAIAKHYVRVDETEIQKLKKVTARLGTPNRGLTDKNRRRLHQFDDPQNVWLLLNLPSRLVDRADKRNDPSSWVALEVQIAVAIEILLMAPMRIANLAALRLDSHITWQGSGRHQIAKLAIPGAEVKNGQPIECALPPESSALIKTYLNKYRPILTDVSNDWLFPSRTGDQKASGYLGRQISERIHKELGLHVNPHLFRHLGALLYLNDNPGGYEVVRRTLTHRSSDTTLNFYTGFETRSATEHFDATILSHRRRLPNTDNRGRTAA